MIENIGLRVIDVEQSEVIAVGMCKSCLCFICLLRLFDDYRFSNLQSKPIETDFFFVLVLEVAWILAAQITIQKKRMNDFENLKKQKIYFINHCNDRENFVRAVELRRNNQCLKKLKQLQKTKNNNIFTFANWGSSGNSDILKQRKVFLFRKKKSKSKSKVEYDYFAPSGVILPSSSSAPR